MLCETIGPPRHSRNSAFISINRITGQSNTLNMGILRWDKLFGDSAASLPSASTVACATAAYMICVRLARYRHWYRLENKIDMPTDPGSAHAIYRQFMGCEYPFLVKKALEFGLFKTYGIPSISQLLAKTKELTVNVSRRYDDTDLLVREFTERPPNSLRSDLAIQRLNYLHGLYPSISNEDYLYVLAVFIVEPIRWVAQYGYRPAHEKEKVSSYLIWKDIGVKMGIKSIPNNFEEMELYLDNYESTYMIYHKTNVALADASRSLFLSVVPSVFHPFGKRLIEALCTQRLRASLGYPEPSAVYKHISYLSLQLMALFTRRLMLPRSRPLLRTPEHPACGSEALPKLCPVFDVFDTNYPDGYRIDELGPERYVKDRALCPLAH